MVVCAVRRRVVVVVRMLDAGQVEHKVSGHHVGLELGRGAPPPLVLAAHQRLAAVPRLHARAVRRRVARRVAVRVARRW